MKRHYDRLIRFDGADSDYLYFSTPSWSGTLDEHGKELRYDMTVNKRDGEMRCTCMDAVCRVKRGDVMEPQGKDACKHQRAALLLFHRIIGQTVEG